MTFAGFLTYAGALAIAAAIPGPGITVIVARALGSGLLPALAMTAGVVLGDVVWLTAVVAGLALVAQAFGAAFMVVKWLGVAYLVWLAWKFWSAGISAEDVAAKRGPRSALSNFLGGLTLTLGNPKTMVFYIAILPTIIDLHAVGLADYAVLAAVTVVVLTLVLVPYAALASRARGVPQVAQEPQISRPGCSSVHGGRRDHDCGEAIGSALFSVS